MTSGNPYQAPRQKAQSPGGSFRWRTIPSALLLGFGGISLAAGLMATFIMAYASWTGSPLYEPGPTGFSREGIIGAAWSILAGISLLSSAAYWLRGRWVTAISIVLVVFAAGYGAMSVGILPGE